MGIAKGIGIAFSDDWHRRFLQEQKEISLRLASDADR
ncbi:hypothetical protein RvY_15124 [Ramazzottius varieornatus]|uniref:Uncharacterized protein n=1 Tax=Ramazzottius varieornatus TaxID=947166 RepID=A0A1D1W0S3_RAMVA|nr:hypothetical protein RvY_15124 [Ramazzottius varieornatus]